MKLYLLRHGDAQPVASSDAERALTEFGENQARRIGSYFLVKGGQVDHFICSPYKRAKQTAAIFKEVSGITCGIIESPNITPDVPLSRAMKELDAYFDGNVIMVSHQPLVSSLITYLVWGETTPRIGMDTASLACLETDVIQPGVADLVWVQHANEIR